MKTKSPSLVPVKHIELEFAGDEFSRKPAQRWKVNTFSEATQVLRAVAADLSYHGGDADTAGLVATALTFAVTYENDIKVGGIVRVRYQSKPDFLDYL